MKLIMLLKNTLHEISGKLTELDNKIETMRLELVEGKT